MKSPEVTNNPATAAPILASVQDTMRTLGVSDSKVRSLVRSGQLEGRRLGRRLMITTTSVDAYAAALPRVGGEG